MFRCIQTYAGAIMECITYPQFTDDGIVSTLALERPQACRSSKAIVAKSDILLINVISVQPSDSDIELDCEIHNPASAVENEIVRETFESSRSQWIDDSIISQWRNPQHRIHNVLSEMGVLYNDWKTVKPAPFALASDPIWLDTGRSLANVGLPWANNQVNLPHDIDTSWPFHFKKFEAEVIQAKGARVGAPGSTGYVTSYAESNLYCIRALQQELKKQFPTERPLLVYDHFESDYINSASQLFGLQIQHVSLSSTLDVLRHRLYSVTAHEARPIIFAATLCNSNAEHDNISVIAHLSQWFPVILHVDAFRSFDYITTYPRSRDRQIGEKLTLTTRNFEDTLRSEDGSILASTIVGGGLNHSRHDPAFALKPASLGGKYKRVAYVRASDATLSGSRDAIAPLWLALYEKRLGKRGLRDIHQYFLSLRTFMMDFLDHQNIAAVTSPYATDIIIKSCTQEQKQWILSLGGSVTPNQDIVLSMNFRFSARTLCSLLHTDLLFHCGHCISGSVPCDKDFVNLYPIPQDILSNLRTTLQSWQIRTRSTAGYPLHLGSYSALGPIIGLFWDLDIPKYWVESKSQELLSFRMESFGVTCFERGTLFKGAFTNGSTMGNRYGIMTALKHFPEAFVYFSAETHYSVTKTVRDCDTLTRKWATGRPRYSKIRCNSNGSICVEALLEQAIDDKKQCIEAGIEYHMILLVNMGTTFVGAKDNLSMIYRTLLEAGIQISFIHVDGALDFGFDACGVKLGPCGAVSTDGTPLVQGVTISHHKALGSVVSGEVICFSPQNQLPNLCCSLNPRIIFETWLYNRVYEPSDLAIMLNDCRRNASYLEESLGTISVATRRNSQSMIVVLERPPSWIVEDFSLRPEDDWVHFITMPHISRETIDRFVDQLASIDRQFSFAFSSMTYLLSNTLGRTIKLKRIRCCSALAKRVSDITESIVLLEDVRGHNTFPDLSIKSIVRGAISAVAVDDHDEIQVVFLASSNRDQSIHAGPVLARNNITHVKAEIVDISRLLLGLLANYMKAKVSIDSLSYEFYTF
ncbi:PLP-dependent transferase [Nemania sp. FL0916]|nr:PLP-dependent transferase [Nemania sp. FL0916]